jgi:hypothetical protein
MALESRKVQLDHWQQPVAARPDKINGVVKIVLKGRGRSVERKHGPDEQA